MSVAGVLGAFTAQDTAGVGCDGIVVWMALASRRSLLRASPVPPP